MYIYIYIYTHRDIDVDIDICVSTMSYTTPPGSELLLHYTTISYPLLHYTIL